MSVTIYVSLLEYVEQPALFISYVYIHLPGTLFISKGPIQLKVMLFVENNDILSIAYTLLG